MPLKKSQFIKNVFKSGCFHLNRKQIEQHASILHKNHLAEINECEHEGSISHVQEMIQKHIMPRADHNSSSDAWKKSGHNLAPKYYQMLVEVNFCLRFGFGLVLLWFSAKNIDLSGLLKGGCKKENPLKLSALLEKLCQCNTRICWGGGLTLLRARWLIFSC